jgi:hypothetical protein
MKRSSSSIAKLVILLSLIIGTTSVIYANKWKVAAGAVRSDVSKLTGNLRELSTSKAAVQNVLVTPAEAPTLDFSLSSLLVQIMKERLNSGISVSSVLTSKNVSASEAASFDKIADSLDGTPLKSARLNVRGTYQTYDGLMGYVAKMRELPVAVVFMKVEGNQFELGLRAYGTENVK